jgi:hypothetical protein
MSAKSRWADFEPKTAEEALAKYRGLRREYEEFRDAAPEVDPVMVFWALFAAAGAGLMLIGFVLMLVGMLFG